MARASRAHDRARGPANGAPNPPEGDRASAHLRRPLTAGATFLRGGWRGGGARAAPVLSTRRVLVTGLVLPRTGARARDRLQYNPY
eukprot:6237007-Prymnesium_polylepis.1